jgi:hypothetical protein
VECDRSSAPCPTCLRVQADVDPNNTVVESVESDNAFPTNGTPADVQVESTMPLSLTFVPVFQTTTGLTGDVTTQNLDEFTSFMRKVLPIKDYLVTLHAPFTTSSPALESNSNASWFQVLGEINALRVAEGRPDYYMGIVGTTYTSESRASHLPRAAPRCRGTAPICRVDHGARALAQSESSARTVRRRGQSGSELPLSVGTIGFTDTTSLQECSSHRAPLT